MYSTKAYSSTLDELQWPVSLKAHEIPLKEALRSVVAQAGLGIAFNAEHELMNGLISVDFENITVGQALDALTEGTELATYISRWGEIVVVPTDSQLLSLEWDTTKPPGGSVVGRVTDAVDREPLPGATLIIKGTNIGASSDIEGGYRLTGAPDGPQTVVASYVGYESIEIPVVVAGGQTVELDIELAFQVVEGQEILITAQLRGQQKAINQQLNSETIVNIVASDRILDLPDANAAESVGRLPGVSIQRNAGEGQKAVIRGLAPKYSSVTLNGERIPPTAQSGQIIRQELPGPEVINPNVDDRSVDLSMISPEILAGIEVYKSLTPDQDADAIAGRVNFVTRRAPEGKDARISLEGGHSNQVSGVKNFASSGFLSDRLLNGRLGVLITGNFERRDRSKDSQNTDFIWQGINTGTGRAVVEVNSLELTHRLETRDRWGTNVAIDYQAGTANAFNATGVYVGTSRDFVDRVIDYSVRNNDTAYGLTESRQETRLLTGSLGGKHFLGLAEFSWSTAFAETVDETPATYGYSFEEGGSFSGEVVVTDGPQFIQPFAKHQVNHAMGGVPATSSSYREDENLSLQANMEIPFTTGAVKAGLQVGGKYRVKDRVRRGDGRGFFFVEYREAFLADNEDAITYQQDISILNYLDETLEIDGFMRGSDDCQEYVAGGATPCYRFPVVVRRMPRDLFQAYEDISQSSLYAQENDYTVNENIAAGYGMVRLDVGKRLMILGGTRYERTDNTYGAKYSRNLQGPFGRRGILRDTTANREYGEWFPMAHMKLDVADWFDVRLAVTRTLSRPDFFNLTPYTDIGAEFRVLRRSNPDLEPTIGWNYDAFLSFHNEYGLFTVGGYMKRLDGIDFLFKRVEQDRADEFFGYTVLEPVNVDETTEVRGYEIELQSNLRFLPGLLSGVVLYGNYSYIDSETAYPYQVQTGFDPVTFIPTIIDTVRFGSMPGQSDQLLNLAFGYETGGFSGRLSVNYQSASLGFLGPREELDGYNDSFTRWDLNLSQRVGSYLTITGRVINLSDLPERAFLGSAPFATGEEFYGRTVALGLRIDY